MMKMNCPHCGLGGRVADELYLEVVKCPECREPFRVTNDVLNDPLEQSADESAGREVEGRASLRMNCPHCELGGTTAEEYYRKVVKCPGCRHVFRVTGNVLVNPVYLSAQRAAEPDVEEQTIILDEKPPVIGETVIDPEPDSEDTGLLDCAVCGFTFSADFIRLIDGQQTCPVCAS